jgi:hypothetical protein
VDHGAVDSPHVAVPRRRRERRDRRRRESGVEEGRAPGAPRLLTIAVWDKPWTKNLLNKSAY